MPAKIAPIISPETLVSLPSQDLVIIDARSGPGAVEKYQQQHLRNAIFVDLENQLSDKKSNAADGGRHPLPPVENFAGLLSELGIQPTDHIVVYDDKNGANAAARFWWMMRAAGHENVQVIDGGYDGAVKAGFPTTDEIPAPKSPSNYAIEKWLLPTVTMQEVDEVRSNNDHYIIDVREAVRYDGITEPIDLVAGHIPGAHNIPFSSNLDSEGKFLSPEQLKEKYEAAIGNRKPENVIVHCGSGVTACHTILAMDAAGMDIPNLYVGSWSEWSRNDKPIATNQ
jgi:thiosulfate/3-mercaptopyruvate sulfurtransferase